MKKKLLIFTVLLLSFTLFASFLLSACDDNGEESEPLLIVYLGDSIAEAIAGSSPIIEREKNGYYGIIGVRNGYEFKNRSVSGHMTSNMLEQIQLPDRGVKMAQTYLKMADIIHVSILGNDFLLNNVSKLMIDASENNFTNVDAIIEQSVKNFADIVEVLRDYNPTAVIYFQTVYNPLFEDSPMINDETRAELAKRNTTAEQFRDYGNTMLTRLNGIIWDYLEEHPGAFDVIDAQTEFNRIYLENNERGRDLIYSDGVHPSPEGHAVIADLIQKDLEAKGLADNAKAVSKYKEMRKEQINRMFSENPGVDAAAVCNAIDGAESCYSITEIYFNAIRGKTPKFVD